MYRLGFWSSVVLTGNPTTKYVLIEFMGKLIQRDNIVTLNIYYDEGLGKRGDKQ